MPSFTAGVLFCGIDMVQGVPAAQAFRPTSFALYVGGFYVYNAMQCPMEAIHGRQSLLHNILSAGTLGAVAVHRGVFGIPFVSPYFFYQNPQYPPAAVAFAVYGGIAGLLSGIQGKPW
mmetsp:Transcript_23503/g.48798  ORF Transcript_23503/g.48798 Transcript_23503/m.48798 type:complete len:118 (-) Transcript_23503:1618-1971(-)